MSFMLNLTISPEFPYLGVDSMGEYLLRFPTRL